MKKILTFLFAALTICLTANAQEQATARVLVPSDCSMDISNGLWLAWFDGYWDSNPTFVQMTPEEGGRIFSASFTPTMEQGSFGYYVINAASTAVEGYQRTSSRTYLNEMTTYCYEVMDNDDNWFYLNDVYDCVLADHNYKPFNLVATPLGGDSVLFEWQVAEGSYYGFNIYAYKKDGSSIDMYANFDQRSLRAKLNVAEQTDFDYWTVTASTDKGGYAARGEGFTVAGDDRLPINLTISADGNQQYTIRWDAGQSVDHFYVSINYGEQVFDNITSHEQQVTLADDGYYTIYVYSRDAANNDLGSIYKSVNTYTQEARDLKLHFYIPEARGFIGANGAAILWRDAEFAGDHILPLVAEGEEAPNWYVATIADFNRSYIIYNLINATTAEAATQTIEGGSFGNYGSTETYLILGTNDNGELYLDGSGSYYPHDYAARNLQLTQVLNKLVFTWESGEDVQYIINAYNEAGEIIIEGYKNQGYENRYEYTSNNDQAFVIARWTVTPRPNYWSTASSLRVENNTPFTVQPSPFTPKNLHAQDNGDGTWTFSWDAIALDTVQQYGIEVMDAAGNYALSRYNMQATSITENVNFMFSGRCAMRVYAYNNWGSTLGNAVDSFTVAPLPAHDISIRILINPLSGYDTSAGVQFDIQSSATSGWVTVNATDDQYGWWKYTINTTERGAYVRLHNEWRNIAIYGDTCLAYTGYFEAEDCEAHANDYMPQNLLATENSDGSWMLSWAMDYTERVDHYYIQVNDSNGSYVCGNDVRNALQWKTPVMAATGRHSYSITVYSTNYSRIGYAEGAFTVEPKAERDIELRVLVQPGAQDGWAAYTYNPAEYDWTNQVVFTEAGGGWLTHTFTTTDPAVTVRFKKNAYYYYGTDFTLADNTCIEYESDFKVVDCAKAHLQNFTLSNLQVADQGNGKFKFSWDCAENPDRFYLYVLTADTVTSVWNTQLNGDERETTTRLNNDSTMDLVWYIVPAKEIDYGTTPLWDYHAFGPNFHAEASAFIPQNVTATPNGDGTWTISWDALPAAVTNYEVHINYPNGNSEYLYPNAGETTCATHFLGKVGNYTAYVYARSATYETLGQATTYFTVSEIAERAINVHLLLHPDAGEVIEQMECETGDGIWNWIDPYDEGNGWYRFTFNSTLPASDVRIFGYQPTVKGDTCLQYTRYSLTSAACDAVAHDYRIKAGTLNAVSEAGRATFSWEPVEKSESYEVQLMRYNDNYGYWYTFASMNATDTFSVYLVPDEYDGMDIKWSVRPSSPHNLNNVDASETVTLHKSQIIFSNLKATTTDSVHYHLSWACNNSNVQYQLLVYLSGSLMVNTQLSAKQYDFTALSGYGSYNWEVRAVNAQGEAQTTWVNGDSFNAKSSLRMVSNLQGSATGRTLHFSWNTASTRVAVELWREMSGWGRVPMFPGGDSIISGNTFDFVTTEDGRYIFEVYAIVDQTPTTYYTIYEENYVAVNIFTQVQTYHVNVSTTVGGSFYGMNPSGNYPNDYQLRICPSSTGNYRFVSWSDGNDNECRMLTVSQDTTLIALYEEIVPQHIVIGAENGRIRIVYQNDTVARIDTTVTWSYNAYIEAIANEGYELYEWSDGYDRASSFRSVNLNKDTTIMAIFKPICYVSVAAGEGGRVQVSGANEYIKANKTYRCSYGSEITIKANPNDGYRFVRWSDGDCNVTRNITVTANLNLTAQFQEVSTPLSQFVVRILSSDTELGEVNQVSGTYYDGDQVTIIATPKEHAKFTGWSDGVAQATRVITVSKDTTITAQFEQKRVTVAISAGVGGSVNTEVNGTYNYGTNITITATPNPGYNFVRWSDGNTNDVRYIELTEDITLTAIFAQQTYLVTFLNADGSLIEANPYLYGEMPACSVTPTLEPTEEWIYTFEGWTPEITAVTGNAVYTAQYSQSPAGGVGFMNAEVTEKAQKLLINGQIYIIRAGKIYTIQGQVVK